MMIAVKCQAVPVLQALFHAVGDFRGKLSYGEQRAFDVILIYKLDVGFKSVQQIHI